MNIDKYVFKLPCVIKMNLKAFYEYVLWPLSQTIKEIIFGQG